MSNLPSRQDEFSFINTPEQPPLHPLPGWLPLKTTIAFDTYWKFAAERQRIFFARYRREPYPWTRDPILIAHKFTNAYRASDRVSQHLIKNVIYDGDQSHKEVFFRTILFKFFNKIETWELLRQSFDTPTADNFSIAAYDKVMSSALAKGARLYSAAYIMPSGGKASPYNRKHQMHLALLDRMLADNLQEKLADCKDMAEAFSLIKAYPSIGDFLAYQYVTDLNYGTLTNFTEMDFTCPGPGAKDGIRKCFSDTAGYSDSDVIKMMAHRQDIEFRRLGIEFPNLWGRQLQLIDCQNLFCEVDKYSRIAHPEITGLSGRTRIKQKFHAAPTPLVLWYPPKWQINERLK